MTGQSHRAGSQIDLIDNTTDTAGGAMAKILPAPVWVSKKLADRGNQDDY